MRLALKWVVSLGIAALFLWLSCRQWPADRIWCSEMVLQGADVVCQSTAGRPLWTLNPWWLGAGFLVLVAVHFLRVLRWQPLVDPIHVFDFGTLNRVCSLSFLALFVFPLRLGEIARPVLIAATGRMRKSAAFGTIAVERLVDGLMMALLLGGVLLVLPGGDRSVYVTLRAGAAVAFLVFGSALFLLFLAYRRRELAVRLVDRLVGTFSEKGAHRIAGMLDAFIQGMRAMPNAVTCFRFLAYTAMYWLVNGFYYYFLALAFGLGGQIGLGASYAMMAAVAVGMMIPNSPANVGSFWYFLLLPATLYGVGQEEGGPLAFALAVWGLMLLQYALFAGWYLFRGGSGSMSMLWSLQKQPMSEDCGS